MDYKEYYKNCLRDYIKSMHSDIDEQFITERSQAAADTFYSAFGSGSDEVSSNEQATQVLYSNLLFSRFDFLNYVLEEHFGLTLTDKPEDLIRQMLEYCEEVYSKYELTDDFLGSAMEPKLTDELTGHLAKYLENHDIQQERILYK